MLHRVRTLIVSAAVTLAVVLSAIMPFPALGQDDPEQLRDLATAYECELAIGAAIPTGPYGILVAIGSPPCVETLANGGLQGYALVQCVLQYPVAVCLGLE